MPILIQQVQDAAQESVFLAGSQEVLMIYGPHF